MYASKLVWNNNKWTNVSDLAQSVVFVDYRRKNSYYFGLEECLNNPILKKMKVGYIDSYRANTFHCIAERIALFTFCLSNRQVFYVGDIFGVYQISDKEIDELRNALIQHNWLEEVENRFHNIGDVRAINNHIEYMRCWNSNNVVGETGRSFILNIRYEKIKFHRPINLTDLTDREVNIKWK